MAEPQYMTEDAETSHSNGLKQLDMGEPLAKTDTAVTIPRSLLEKLYLDAPNAVKGDLRKTFGNPTPVGVACLVLCAFPLSCDLMGWRGAGGLGSASGPTYIFLGMILLIASILEWILGNTYIFVVLSTLAGFLLTLGATFQPQFNAAGLYGGMMEPGFYASFAFWACGFTVFFTIYTICALRTNIMFCIVLFALTVTGGLLTGSFWQAAGGNMSLAAKLQVGGGGALFFTALSAVYVFISLMFLSVDFPIQLPLGDLSDKVPGYTDLKKRRMEKRA